MEGYHIRLFIKGIQVYIFGYGASGVVGVKVVCENSHAQSFGYSALGLAYASEAYYAHGLVLKLYKGVIPIAPVRIVCPPALVYSGVVVAYVVAYLQKQSYGILAY